MSEVWEQHAATARNMAKAFMRQAPCRWIDIALDEGWAYSLEEMARDSIRETLRKGQGLPSIQAMGGFPVRDEDHTYCKRNGRQLNSHELEQVREARAKLRRSAA